MYLEIYFEDNESLVCECEVCGSFIPIESNHQSIFKKMSETICILKDGEIIKCPNCDNIHKSDTPLVEVYKSTNDNDNTPHCPTCQSTNIKKISTTNKVGSAVAFGVFSLGHLSKTFKCNDCGMKF